MPFDFACPDWADRLTAGKTPIADLPLDAAEAARAVAIYNKLRLPDVAGKPALAQAGGEWFRDIIRAVFGSVDAVTGERGVGEVFCLVPKKNSKTTNAAGLGIVALLMNTTPNVEMLIIGPTKDVAATCFGQAIGMIEADPSGHLADRFHVAEHLQKITDRLTGATLEVKSFDMRVLTGKIPALVIIDEIHVMGSSAHAARILTQIRGGMITRADSLLVMITTQSDEAPAGVFKAELQYARRVRDGAIIDSNLLPVLYEFPEDIQTGEGKAWRDPRTWPMVLPNLGKSITIARLLLLYRKALEKGPDEEMRWASQHLNIQLGLGTHSERWVALDFWPGAKEPADLARIMDLSDVVTAGVDGGGLDDLFALGVIGRCKKTRIWRGWVRAWAQPEVLDRRKDISPALRDFAADGDLIICDGPMDDFNGAGAILEGIQASGLFPERDGIGLDPYGIQALVDELATRGLEGDLLSAIRQGWQLSPAILGLERKVKDKTFLHAGQPLMDWAMGNVRIEVRGNAVSVTKATAGRAKIDPVIGILNAAMLMQRNPDAAAAVATSPWDDPDYVMPAF